MNQTSFPFGSPPGSSNTSAAATPADVERAKEIVRGLGQEPSSAAVFEAFEQLDALPPAAALAPFIPLTGPAPDIENLDVATRVAHGFAPARLAYRFVRHLRPARASDLDELARTQVAAAGEAWDGQKLDAGARLSASGEASFARTLELRTFADREGTLLFDVVLSRDESGVVFRAGTTEVAGYVAYGVVEMKDKLARVAVQEALKLSEVQPLPKPKAPPVLAEAATKAIAKPKAQAAGKKAASADAAPRKSLSGEAPKPGVTKAAAAKATPAKGAAAKAGSATKSAAASKADATKVAPAKPKAAAKTSAKPGTKKAAVAKQAPKGAGTRKAVAAETSSASKKPAAKTSATAKPSNKKVAGTPSSKPKASTKTAASKPATTKRTTAKSTSKKASAKKPSSKKAAASTSSKPKAAAKKPSKKKASASTSSKPKAGTSTAGKKRAAKKTRR